MQAGGTYNTISGSSAETIDSWDKTVYTSAKYMVQVIDNGNIHTQELMVIQDGTDVYISEYGIVTTNGDLGVFDGVISGGNVLITFTPHIDLDHMMRGSRLLILYPRHSHLMILTLIRLYMD